MPSIGPMELIVVLVIALVVLGPKKLPDVGRSIGNSAGFAPLKTLPAMPPACRNAPSRSTP